MLYNLVVILCATIFDIKNYVLHTKCIYVFCVVLRTESDYFPVPRKYTG
jgi:hypothetical protein